MAVWWARQSASGTDSGTSEANAFRTTAQLNSAFGGVIANGDEVVIIGEVDGSGYPIPWGRIWTASRNNVILRFLHAVIYANDVGTAVLGGLGSGIRINPDDEGHLTCFSVAGGNSGNMVAFFGGSAIVRRVYGESDGTQPGVAWYNGDRYENCVMRRTRSQGFAAGNSNGTLVQCTADGCTSVGFATSAWSNANLFDCVATNMGAGGVGFNMPAGTCTNFYRCNAFNNSTNKLGAAATEVGYTTLDPTYQDTSRWSYVPTNPAVRDTGAVGASAGNVNGFRASTRGANIFGIPPSQASVDIRALLRNGTLTTRPLNAYDAVSATFGGGGLPKWDATAAVGTLTTPAAGEDVGANRVLRWADFAGRRLHNQGANLNATLDQNDATDLEEYRESTSTTTPVAAPTTVQQRPFHAGDAGKRYWRVEISLRETAAT